MNKNTIIGVLAGAVAILLIIYIVGFFTPVSVSPGTPVPDVKIGAMPGSELPGPEFKVAGVSKQYVRGTMASATTTLCAFKNPFGSATSTMESFDYQITTGTSTAATLVVSVSTGRYATSTASNTVSAQTVASGATDSMSFMSEAADEGQVAPNSYVLLSTEGVGLGGYTYKGTCQVVFRGF